MANRAYLYFVDEQVKASKSEVTNGSYLDSRDNIPFVWWFLFARDSLLLGHAQAQDSGRNGVRLSIEWLMVPALFRKRIPHIVRLSKGLIRVDRLEAFLESLSRSPGRYLVLDADEILQDDGNADEIRIGRILGLIDDCDRTKEEAMIDVDFYSRHMRKLSPEQALPCLVGYTY